MNSHGQKKEDGDFILSIRDLCSNVVVVVVLLLLDKNTRLRM